MAREAGECNNATNPSQPSLLAEIKDGLSKLRRAKDALSYWHVGRNISRLKARLPHGNAVPGAGWITVRAALVRKGFAKSTIENCVRLSELTLEQATAMTYAQALVVTGVTKPADLDDPRTHLRKLDHAITEISKSLLNLHRLAHSNADGNAEISKNLDISIARLQQRIAGHVNKRAARCGPDFFPISTKRRIP